MALAWCVNNAKLIIRMFNWMIRIRSKTRSSCVPTNICPIQNDQGSLCDAETEVELNKRDRHNRLLESYFLVFFLIVAHLNTAYNIEAPAGHHAEHHNYRDRTT